MAVYIIRRLLHMIPVLLGVAILVFILFSSVGEDPVRMALGEHATVEAIDALRQKWGLNKAPIYQFFDFIGQVVTFDYGKSFNTGEELINIFKEGAVISLSLTAFPYFFGLFMNIALAIIIAYYRGSWIDRYSTLVFVAAMSFSYLVYIIACQYLLAFRFGWFPINGYESGWEGISFFLLPWLILVLVSTGPNVRIFRTIFLDETKADYVRTAFAKGASKQSVLFVHILKNAMIPIITYTVVSIPFLILGAFLLERFFSIPGIGDVLITAINNGDFPVIKGVTMMIALAYTFFNLLTDLLYAYVDPRVSLA